MKKYTVITKSAATFTINGDKMEAGPSGVLWIVRDNQVVAAISVAELVSAVSQNDLVPDNPQK